MIKIQIVCKSYHTWPHVFLFSNLILQSNMVTEMDLDVRGDTTESFLKILLRMFLGSCCILKKIIKKNPIGLWRASWARFLKQIALEITTQYSPYNLYHIFVHIHLCITTAFNTLSIEPAVTWSALYLVRRYFCCKLSRFVVIAWHHDKGVVNLPWSELPSGMFPYIWKLANRKTLQVKFSNHLAFSPIWLLSKS